MGRRVCENSIFQNVVRKLFRVGVLRAEFPKVSLRISAREALNRAVSDRASAQVGIVFYSLIFPPSFPTASGALPSGREGAGSEQAVFRIEAKKRPVISSSADGSSLPDITKGT